MSKLTYKDGLNFDIYVMELCELIKPKSCSDLEDLAQDLHERIEMSIEDYIYDDEDLDIGDYSAYY